MRNGWREVTVGEIAASTRNALVGGPFGSNLVSHDYVDHGVPVIRGQNMDGRWVDGDFAYVTAGKAQTLQANLASPDDIVFTQRGTLGQVALVPTRPFENYLVSQSQMKLTVNPEIADPLFFYYVFRSAEQQDYIKQHSIQTGVPHTNLGILRNTPVPLPPLDEQRAISSILGSLDDKIELNRRMNATLEATAGTVFKSWFVDFGPVRVKAEGRDPRLPKEIADCFPSRLVESEWGEIPEGWEVGTLADFSSLNPETWSKETRPAIVNYVDLSNTKWGRIEAVTAHAKQDVPSRARRVLRPRDTIIGTVRPGNGSYAFISEEGLTGSTGFAVLRPLKAEYTEYVYFGATMAENIEVLSHLADGAAYPAVRPEVVAATWVVRPGGEALFKFSSVAGSLLAEMAKNERESNTLALIRDALLPKLVSGDLRVQHTGAAR